MKNYYLVSLVILTLFMNSHNCFASDKYAEGYIITKYNDTLFVRVNAERGAVSYSKKIEYLDASNKNQSMDASDILECSYTYQGQKYLFVSLGKEILFGDSLNTDSYSNLLYKVEVSGYLTLYSVMQNTAGTSNTVNFIIYNGEKYKVVEYEKFIEQMKVLLVGDNQLIDKIIAKQLTIFDLTKIVSMHNEWHDAQIGNSK